MCEECESYLELGDECIEFYDNVIAINKTVKMIKPFLKDDVETIVKQGLESVLSRTNILIQKYEEDGKNGKSL